MHPSKLLAALRTNFLIEWSVLFPLSARSSISLLSIKFLSDPSPLFLRAKMKSVFAFPARSQITWPNLGSQCCRAELRSHQLRSSSRTPGRKWLLWLQAGVGGGCQGKVLWSLLPSWPFSLLHEAPDSAAAMQAKMTDTCRKMWEWS